MMLKPVCVRAALFLAMMLMVSVTPSARARMDEPPRAVWVEVQLRTPSGPALEADVPVTIVACRRESWLGVTDAKGFLRTQIEVPATCDWISVGVWKYDFNSDGEAKRLRNWRRVVDLENRWSVPADRQIKVVRGQDTYTTTIELVEGVRVTGKVLAPDGSMRTVQVEREGRMAHDAALSLPKPSFNLTTVPKSASTFIYVLIGDMSSPAYVIKIIELTAAQTTQAVDLGTLTVEFPPLSAQTAFSIAGIHQRPADQPPGSAFLVAVRESGLDAMLISFGGQLKVAGPSAQSVSLTERLPEGTWYILPGEIDNPAIVPAIRRLRAGQSAVLDAANIPKVVVPAPAKGTEPSGPSPTVTIDFWPTFERMLKITPPTPSAPERDSQVRPTP